MAGKKKDASDKKASEEGEENDVESEDSDEDGKSKDPPSARAGYIGLGLVGSLVVGFDPLRDAFQGNGSFENAILRFLACVAVCVIGAGTIGRLIDTGTHTRRVDRQAGGLKGGSGAGDSGAAGSGEASQSGSDREETKSAGPATSGDSGRQGTEQQTLASSEETAR